MTKKEAEEIRFENNKQLNRIKSAEIRKAQERRENMKFTGGYSGVRG